MPWFTRIRAKAAAVPHHLDVGDDVRITLIRTQDGTIGISISAPQEMKIVSSKGERPEGQANFKKSLPAQK